MRSFWSSVARAAQFADPTGKIRRVVLGRDEEEEEVGEGDGNGEHRDDEGAGADVHEPGHGEGRGGIEGNADESTALLASDGEEVAPLRTKLDRKPHERVEEMQRQREETRAQVKDDDERGGLLITTVRRDDGTTAEVVVGRSSVGQTIFNSANTLIGIAILALPLAFRYAGWLLGLLMLFASSLLTHYTAGLLAKCADVDSSLANFGDIAFVAFGEKGRVATSALITIEMLLTCVGLVILFADTVHSLGAAQSLTTWKIIAGLILAPLNFIPLQWLGYTSFLGIFCSLAVIVTAFVLGFVKHDTPGSLLQVATTHALPPNWRAFPLSWGLMMALWTGHSVFPNIYRDMKHPPAYKTGLRWIFGFVTSVDLSVAVIGYLLYGPHLVDELTTNILQTPGYPAAAKIFILVLILILPLTKFPLQCAPIVSTLEVLTTIDPRAALLRPTRLNRSRFLSRLAATIIRLLTTFLVVLAAILIPSFELIAALLGGLFGYLICVIIPLTYHLAMFRRNLSPTRVALDCAIIGVSACLGIVGTVWEFLPDAWVRGEV